MGSAFHKNKTILSDKYLDATGTQWKWSKPSLGPAGVKFNIPLAVVTLSPTIRSWQDMANL